MVSSYSDGIGCPMLRPSLRPAEAMTMSSPTTTPASKLPHSSVPGAPTTPPAPVAFHYTQSESFVALLHELGASLLVSTYQANKLLAVRASGSGLSTLVRTFDKPMGLAVDGSRLVIGTRKEVWFLRNAPDIAPRIEPAGLHDACYLPRSSHVTGDIGVHEIAWATPHPQPLSPEGRGEKELWIVSTRFSCLATLSPDYSFVPRW